MARVGRGALLVEGVAGRGSLVALNRQHLLLVLLLGLWLPGISALPPFQPATAAQDIYTDTLAPGWSNWSWATVDLQATAPVHSGSHSIAVTYGAWQGLYLHYPELSTAGVSHLRFFIHGGSSGGQRLLQVANVLKFPGPDANGAIADVTVEVKLPGADATQTLTMTPEVIALPNPLASPARAMPINYEIQAPVAYLTWNGFEDTGINMAVLEQFLSQVQQTAGLNGVVLDLRGNGGRWDNLYFTMASYFFNAEKPASMHWIDMDVFDPAVNGLVREAPDERLISAPRPELYYDGPVVILVDNNCASSCEFFSQFMQKNGRASVVAQYATKGAGAPINRVTMPGGIVFQYTKGRSYFAGTEELNLEAKGVTPDVKVPVTEETEQAKLQGRDPVLAAAVEVLANLAVQATTNAITMVPLPDSGAGYTAVVPEGWTFAEQLQAYVSADSQLALGYYTPDTTDVAALLASLGIPDAQAALVDTRSANGLDWSIYGSEVQSFSQRLAVAQVDGKLYVIRLLAPPEEVDALQSAVLEPAIAAFAVAQ